VSRLFIDFNARISNLNWSEQQEFVINIADPSDTFETNRKSALRGLQQYGFCAESIWPYKRDLYMHVPPKHVYNESARRSIVPLKVPINIISVKTCLAHQIPVLIGIELSSDEAYHNRGYVKIPEKPPNEGFHACLVVGYDDRIQHFIIRNSWGADWVCNIYLIQYKILH
jgi:C1A family cysteine protease